jgi:hypothetical protein
MKISTKNQIFCSFGSNWAVMFEEVVKMEKRSGIFGISILFIIMLLLGAFIVVATDNVSAAQDGDYTYTQSGGVATIVGYTGAGGAITIPSTLGGFPTRAIGQYAFTENSLLTAVTIPSSVTSIGDQAFSWTNNLLSISFQGLVAPTSVHADWVASTNANLRGHAYAASNFPLPASLFSGLIMGDYITPEDYTYTVTEGKATIIGYIGAGGAITIPSTLGGAPTVAIGDGSFNNDQGHLVTSVIIPNSVTSIGGFAFLSCTSLTTVTFTPTSQVATIGFGAFNSCSALTSITIPDSVTSLDSAVFDSCTSLTSVTIGNCVTSIGDTTFLSCTSLTTVTIGSSVTTIGNNAFDSCTSLTSIIIPDSVTTIGNNAFDSCYDLTSVTIGSGVITIGNYAFSYCFALTSITIPDSVTTIGTDAFSSCTGLTTVTIGSGVTSIGGYSFFYCTALTAITVDPVNGNYANNAGDGVLYNKAITTLIQYPIGNVRTSFTIPDSVITIGEYAFGYGVRLTTVTIGNSVTSIGANAFQSCTALTSIVIPDSVTSIGTSAFSACIHMTSVTIGSSVTTIGNYAFDSCIALTSIIFLEHEVPSVGTDWIQNTPAGIIGHAYLGSHFPTPGNVFPEGQSRGADGLLMSADDLTHYDIEVDGDQVAGVGFTGTITARDVYGNTVPVDKTLTALRDGDANLYSGPSYDTELYTCTLVDGVGTLYVKDTTAETITLTVLEDPPSSIYGYCYVVIKPAALDHFTVTGAPSFCIAGNSWAGGSGIVTAYDVYDNVKTDYTGQVYFTSTDGAATLPYTSGSKYTFTTGEDNDNGVHIFDGAGFALFTAGSRTITITDGEVSLTSGAITVNPAAIDHFTVTGITDPVVAGVLSSVTVTAYDVYDNVKTNYVGTIQFTSSDVKGTTLLPEDYTFLLSDAGVKLFDDGIKLTTTGDQSVTVTSTVGEKTGSQTDITVNLAAIDHYHVASSTPQTAGAGWSGTATAKDEFDNTVTTDSATVVTMTATGAALFYTSGTYETLGNTYTLSSGVATFYVRDTTAQTITLTVTDPSEKTGTSGNIVVNPAVIDHYHVASASPQIAGSGWSGTATAQDAFHNVVTTDSATVVLH